MTLDPGQVNWVAVVIAGLIYFAIGAVWYSPLLFSGAWQRSIGGTPSERRRK